MGEYYYIKLTISVFVIIIASFFTNPVHAQDDKNITIEVLNSDQNTHKNLINSTVRIINNAGRSFAGYLNVQCEESLSVIYNNKEGINIAPSDTIYQSVKLLINHSAHSGESPVTYYITDPNGETAAYITYPVEIPYRESLTFFVEQPNIYITNPQDSVILRAVVSNRGNSEEDVSVVFTIPTVSGDRNFIEKNISIKPSETMPVTMKFRPSSQLLERQQFQANVFASKGKERQIIGNSAISIWNVLSEQKYIPYLPGEQFTSFIPNTITASYRQIGENNMIQLRGSGSFDLPAGNLEIKGNLYKINNSDNVYTTNTAMTYHYLSNDITIGNINEEHEFNLYGRGAKYTANKDKTNEFSVVVIDNNYNLFGTEALGSRGYNLYAIMRNRAYNNQKGFNLSYLFNEDPSERAKNNVLGGEVRFGIGQDWRFKLKGSGVLSKLESRRDIKPSGSTELSYQGSAGRMQTYGNYYYSSKYFPGTRRGVLLASQTFSYSVSSYMKLKSNIFYFNTSPRSYNYSTTRYTQNLRADIGININKSKKITPAFSFQYQSEKSNSYQNFSNSTLSAYRLVGQINWRSHDTKHLILFGTENGIVRYPEKNGVDYQGKISAIYSYKWMNLSAIYQQGAYYIAEYSSLKDPRKQYHKFILSPYVTKEFGDGKHFIRTGINFLHDRTPNLNGSIFVGYRYSPTKLISIYTDANFQQYKYSDISSNLLNVEVGITLNLGNTKLSRNKKSKLKVLLYYDKNSNGIYDDNDSPAPNHHINVDKKPFITNSEGNIVYSKVPFGNYLISATTQNGWFNSGTDIQVKKYHTGIEVPLRQTGTLSGKIELIYDKKQPLAIDDTEIQRAGIKIVLKDSLGNFKHQIITDEKGGFMLSLPPGDYIAEINESSLPNGMIPIDRNIPFTITAKKMTVLPDFKIGLKQKTINVKTFTQ